MHDASANTVTGRCSAAGKDDGGKESDIRDGVFSGIPVSRQ